MQLLCLGIGVVLGVWLPQIHSGSTVPTARAVEVLGAIGFGVLGLVSVIFSLLFLVVQSSNSTLTPRLNLFQGDPWIWRTYGMAIGLFVFSTTAFLAIGSDDHVSVAVPALAFAVGLVIIGLLRSIQLKAFASLQLNNTLAAIQSAGRRTIDDLYPDPIGEPPKSPRPAPEAAGRPVLWSRPSTTLEQLDLRGLLDATERADAVVVFRVEVGATLTEGATIAEAHGDVTDAAVVGSCVTGVNRTFDQDPLFALRLLSDIGLRALSSAVNDPATAVQALDAIVGLLAPLAVRDLAVGAIDSPTGTTRVWVHLPVWADFVGEGLDELLAASTRSSMMLTHTSSALTRLAEQTAEINSAEIEKRSRWVQKTIRARRHFPTWDL